VEHKGDDMHNDCVYIVNTVVGGYYDTKIVIETFILYASSANSARDEAKRTLLSNEENTGGLAYRARKISISQAMKAIDNGARNWTDI
jgi:hypothetical protein